MLKFLLADKRLVFMLFLINLFGTIYGFIWYKSQLAITPPIFLIFVPDSPMASMFFTIFLLFFLFDKKVPYIESLALITLFKYGIWAVVMNILTLITTGNLSPQGYMLIASHAAMAVQGLLFAPFYRLKLRHVVVAAIWTLHNDVIDYVFGQMPIYATLTQYMNEIGYFTFWLSMLSIYIAYKVMQKNKQVMV